MRKFVKVKVNVSSQGSRSQLKGCIRIKVRLFVHGCLPCARLAMHFNSRRLDMCSQAPIIPLCQSAVHKKCRRIWLVCLHQPRLSASFFATPYCAKKSMAFKFYGYVQIMKRIKLDK